MLKKTHARTVFSMRSVNVDAYKDWWIITACLWGWRKDGTWTETHWSLARSQASSCLLLPADASVGPLTTGSGVWVHVCENVRISQGL